MARLDDTCRCLALSLAHVTSAGAQQCSQRITAALDVPCCLVAVKTAVQGVTAVSGWPFLPKPVKLRTTVACAALLSSLITVPASLPEQLMCLL